jgi:uncharacterized protein (TIGR03437 family)
MSRLFTNPAWSLLLAVSAFSQTQNFSVGQWFYGHNVTTDLPSGVTDLTDNMWGTEGHTCPIVIISGKASLVCRDTVAGGPYNTVVSEGDSRLGGGHLAIPTTSTTGPNGTSPYGRYISSMVRPGPTNLYFTTVVTPGSGAEPFNHQTAFRLQNYQTLQRVAGAGDTVTFNRTDVPGTPPVQATLSAAGPMDANSAGTEFIYLEAAGQNFYALCEVTSTPGVYDVIYAGPQSMYDSPWGMGGFAFDYTQNHGGIIFSQKSVIDRTDLTTLQGGPAPYPIAIQGQIFAPPEQWIPNLLLSAFFRSSVDLTSFYMSWGNLPSGVASNQPTPNEFLQQGISPLPNGTGWTSIYQSAVGTPNETILSTFAASGNLMVAGVAPFAAANNLILHGGGAAWPFNNLLYYTGGAWTSVIQSSTLPDTATAPKSFYQGVTAHGCQLEFATKQNTGATDGSGAFYALYRLYRPCLTSASLNTASRELVVTGVNLADQVTAVYLMPPGPNATLQGPLPLISATSTEVDATAASFTNGSQVVVVVNGTVSSDPLDVVVTVATAPILADLTDVNGNHTSPVALKLMTLWGDFQCQTAATQTVNYPLTLGNCSVAFENGVAAPMLYAGPSGAGSAFPQQINFLMPASLTLGPHSVTVTRQDANGSFSSGPFLFNIFADGPVEFYYNGNVIVQVVRNGLAVLIGPTDPIHPGEYLTVYITGANAQIPYTSATVGGVAAQFAQAYVNWAQGLLQVNVLVPPGTGPNPTVAIGDAPTFNITVQ